MLVNIVRVKYLDGYKLELEFENGVVKVVNFEEDLKKYSGPVVTPLKDIEYFKRVRLNKEIGTIEWDSGFDCCSSYLYETGAEIKRK